MELIVARESRRLHAELPFASWGIEGRDIGQDWNCVRHACFEVDAALVNSKSGTVNVRLSGTSTWINSIPARMVRLHPSEDAICHEVGWPDYSPDDDLTQLALRVTRKTGSN